MQRESGRRGFWALLLLVTLFLTGCGQSYHYARQESWLNPFNGKYVNDQAYNNPDSPGWQEIDHYVVVHKIEEDPAVPEAAH